MSKLCDECETVAHCMKHGCIPKQQALDEKAENARDLGLGYEPAQPAQEPIARVVGYYAGRCVIEPMNRAMVLPDNMALYTAQPQRQPLTEAEYMKALGPLRDQIFCSAATLQLIVRALESAIVDKP